MIKNNTNTNTNTIEYGIEKTPFGACVVAWKEKGICFLSFLEKDRQQIEEKKIVEKKIQEMFPTSTLVNNQKKAKEYLKRIFTTPTTSSNTTSKADKTSLPVVFSGTDFQIKVWKELRKIPRGKVKTYTEIAKAVGSPQAVRAVGSACGKNTLAYIVPCHRVIAASGKLGGYKWGIDRKKALLDWEGTFAGKKDKKR